MKVVSLLKTVNLMDHDPFGMLLVGRNWEEGSEYRYGFNGKESVVEIFGDGNALDFGARIYDGRLGRWFSIDILARKYPNLSPFIYVANNPIVFIDPDGKKIMVSLADGSQVEYIPGIKPTNSDFFLNQIHQAVSYAMQNDPNNTFEKLSGSTNVVTINQILTENNETVCDVNSDRTGLENINIYWNPLKAAEYEDGTAASPATILLHEAGHAERYLETNTKEEVEQLEKDLLLNGTDYDNDEEKRVIDNIETSYINTTNVSQPIDPLVTTQIEGTRKNHRVERLYVSAGVTSIDPVDGTTVKGQAGQETDLAKKKYQPADNTRVDLNIIKIKIE